MKKGSIKKGASSIVSTGTAAVTGAAVGGIPGAVVSTVLKPVAKSVLSRMLSIEEKKRIEKVEKLAKEEINKKLNDGAQPRSDITGQQAKILLEGTLLASRDTYEEKKIALLAHLVSSSIFTNTPIDNCNQALIVLERLSYRQICILSVVGAKHLGIEGHQLSSKGFRDAEEKHKHGDEKALGVYHDTLLLLNDGILMQKGPQTFTLEPSFTVGNI